MNLNHQSLPHPQKVLSKKRGRQSCDVWPHPHIVTLTPSSCSINHCWTQLTSLRAPPAPQSLASVLTLCCQPNFKKLYHMITTTPSQHHHHDLAAWSLTQITIATNGLHCANFELWYGDTSTQTIDHLGQSIGSQWDCRHVTISAMNKSVI